MADLEPTLEDVADALYIVAQMAGTSGDYGTPENDDLRQKFERQANTLLHAEGTKFCKGFIAIVHRDLGDVGYSAAAKKR